MVNLKIQILHLIRSHSCLSTKQIMNRTSKSLYAVRKALRELKAENKIDWFANWYGCNSGYRRMYKIKKESQNGN